MGCGGSKAWRRTRGSKYAPNDDSSQQDIAGHSAALPNGKSLWTQAELEKLTTLQLLHWLEVLRVDFKEGIRVQDAVSFLWAEIEKSQHETLKEVDGPGKLEAWPLPHLLKWLGHFDESKVLEVSQRDVLLQLLQPHINKMPPPAVVNQLQDTFLTQVDSCVQQIKALAANHFCALLKEVAEIENQIAKEQTSDQAIHLNGRVIQDFDGHLGSVLNGCPNQVASNHSLLQVALGDLVEVSHRDKGGWVWCTKQNGAKGWIPANAVAEIARAVIACKPEEGDDPDEMLFLAEGEEVEVLMRHYSGWSLCKKSETEQEGWVPDTHLDDNPRVLTTKPYRRLLDALQQLLESTQAAEAAVFQIRIGQQKGEDFKKQLYGLVLSLVEDYRNICDVVKGSLMQENQQGSLANEDFPMAKVIQATKIVIETQLPTEVDSKVKVIVQDPSGWAWCQDRQGKEGWVPMSSLRLKKRESTSDTAADEENLPDWIQIGARCVWASKNRKRRLHVRIDRICRVRRKILVTFEVSKKAWKVVGFDDLQNHDCPLKPTEATVLEASPIKEDGTILESAPKKSSTSTRKNKTAQHVVDAARESLMEELQLMALDDGGLDDDDRSSMATTSPTGGGSASASDYDIAQLDSLSDDDEDPMLEASGHCDFRRQAATSIQARARGIATRKAVNLSAKRAALKSLQGWFRRARARQLSSRIRKAEIQVREQAATKIQASQRRRQAQTQYKVLKKQNQEERAAVCIQSIYRGQQARRCIAEVHQESQAATKLQSVWKGCLARRKLDLAKIEAKEFQAALTLQLAYKQHQARSELAERRKKQLAAIAIQRIARGNGARRSTRKVRLAHEQDVAKARTAAAVRIQTSQRGWVARAEVAHMRKQLAAALQIQRCIRAWRARIRVVSIRQENGAKRIQAAQRGRQARRLFEEKRRTNRAALVLQTMYRGHAARLAYCEARTAKQVEAERRAKDIAARTIQFAYRQYILRKRNIYFQANRAAMLLQSVHRGNLGRRRVQDLRLCAAKEEIMTSCQGLPARANVEVARRAGEIAALKGEEKATLMQSIRQEVAAVSLQAFVRGLLARRAVQRLRETQAAYVILRLWQGGKVRLLQQRQRCAALRIQAVYRGSCSRMAVRVAREQQNAATKLTAAIQDMLARSQAVALRAFQSHVWAENARIHREEQEQNAALTLQRVQRGRQGRSEAARLRELWEQEQEAKRLQVLQVTAALRIQALVRGCSSRAETKHLLDQARQTAAALRIQILYRGRKGRHAAARRREESEADAVLNEVRGLVLEEFQKDSDEVESDDEELERDEDGKKKQLSKTKAKLLVERVQGALAKQAELFEAAGLSDLARHRAEGTKKIDEQVDEERRELYANFTSTHGITPDQAATQGDHSGVLAALAREERRLMIKARADKLALNRACVARLEAQRRGMLREKLCLFAKLGESVPREEVKVAFHEDSGLLARLLVEDAVGEAAKIAQTCSDQAEQPSHSLLQKSLKVSILQPYLLELEQRLQAECGGPNAIHMRPQTASRARPGETNGQARERQLREQSEASQFLKRAEDEEKKLRHCNEVRTKRIVDDLLRCGRENITKIEKNASEAIEKALQDIAEAEARLNDMRQRLQMENETQLQDLKKERERKQVQLHGLHNITVAMQIEKDRVEKLLSSSTKATTKTLQKALRRVKRVHRDAKRLEVDGAANKQSLSVIFYTLRSLEARVAKECRTDINNIHEDDDDNDAEREPQDPAAKEYIRKKKEKWEAQDRAFREALEAEVRNVRERLKAELEEAVQDAGFNAATEIAAKHSKPLARLCRRVVESEGRSEDLRERIAELPVLAELATVLMIVEGRLRNARNQSGSQSLHRAAQQSLPMLRSLGTMLKVKKVSSPRFPKARALQQQLQEIQKKIQTLLEMYPKPERVAKQEEEVDEAAEDEDEKMQNAVDPAESDVLENKENKQPASLPPPPPSNRLGLTSAALASDPGSPPKLPMPQAQPTQRRQSLLTEAMDGLSGLEGALNALSTSVVAESNGAVTASALSPVQRPSSAMKRPARPPSAGPVRPGLAGFESAQTFGSSAGSNLAPISTPGNGFAPASGSGFAPASGLGSWESSGPNKPVRPQSAAVGSSANRKSPVAPASLGNLKQPSTADVAPQRPLPTVAAWN